MWGVLTGLFWGRSGAGRRRWGRRGSGLVRGYRCEQPMSPSAAVDRRTIRKRIKRAIQRLWEAEKDLP